MTDDRLKELYAMLDKPPTAHFPPEMMREVLDALVEEQAKNLDLSDAGWITVRRRELGLV